MQAACVIPCNIHHLLERRATFWRIPCLFPSQTRLLRRLWRRVLWWWLPCLAAGLNKPLNVTGPQPNGPEAGTDITGSQGLVPGVSVRLDEPLFLYGGRRIERHEGPPVSVES
jgi:hypothetical protein